VEQALSLFEIVGGVPGAVAVAAAALGAARGMHRRYQRWCLTEKLRSHLAEAQILTPPELSKETTGSPRGVTRGSNLGVQDSLPRVVRGVVKLAFGSILVPPSPF